MPWVADARGIRDSQNLRRVRRCRDGRVGWQHPTWPNSPDRKTVEVELQAGRRRPGRLTDRNAKPLAGVEVAPVMFGPGGGAERWWLYQPLFPS